jgi:tellurite resistance protein TerC
VIIVILFITTVASLLSPRGRAQNAVAGARRHAAEYLDQADAADPAEREKLFTQMVAEEGEITALPTKYRRRIRRKQELMKLLGQAHRAHDAPAPDSRSASSPR